MNRRQALSRLAALFGAGVAAPAILAAEAPAPASASPHLAKARAWQALADCAGGAQEINVYINPWDPTNPAYARNVESAMRMAKERYGDKARITLRPCPSTYRG